VGKVTKAKLQTTVNVGVDQELKISVAVALAEDTLGYTAFMAVVLAVATIVVLLLEQSIRALVVVVVQVGLVLMVLLAVRDLLLLDGYNNGALCKD
jgi:hypothetical protein